MYTVMNFSFFTVFLKKRNISSKIKWSKITDYAALSSISMNSAIADKELVLSFHHKLQYLKMQYQQIKWST